MTSPSTTVTGPPAGRYDIDLVRSEISFTTPHRFGMGKVKGSFKLSSATMVVGEPAASSVLTASASAASFDTSNDRRDTHVKSDAFLDVANHPTIDFVSNGVTRQDGKWVVTGSLTARGGTAPVALTITALEIHDGELDLTAIGEIDRYAHGITKLKGMAGRKLALVITAHASPATS